MCKPENCQYSSTTDWVSPSVPFPQSPIIPPLPPAGIQIPVDPLYTTHITCASGRIRPGRHANVGKVCWVKHWFPSPKGVNTKHDTSECATDWRQNRQVLCRAGDTRLATPWPLIETQRVRAACTGKGELHRHCSIGGRRHTGRDI